MGNYYINKDIPVKSQTIYIPKQKRYIITHKGKILDFENMSTEDKESYFNDEEEQERQNSLGLRHRNKEKIRCRYSFINSRTKIKESLDQIEKNKTKSSDFNFKYYTATKKSNCESNDNKEDYNLENKLDKLIIHLHGGYKIQIIMII